jgi:cobalt-zinc-cadmium resistance protein CzcA
VVTIVYDDLDRICQDINCREIKSSDKIPAGFGTPEMGPLRQDLAKFINTPCETEFKSIIPQLRTIQDWVVKRQLQE